MSNIFKESSKYCLLIALLISSYVLVSAQDIDQQYSLVTAQSLKPYLQSYPTAVKQSILKQLDVLIQQSSGRAQMFDYYQQVKYELISSLLGVAYEVSSGQQASGSVMTGSSSIPHQEVTRVCGLLIRYPTDFTGSRLPVGVSALVALLGGDRDRDRVCLSVATGIKGYYGSYRDNVRIRRFLLELIDDQY